MGVHAFLKSISPKMIIIARLEFELLYIIVTVQHIRYNVMGTPEKLS